MGWDSSYLLHLGIDGPNVDLQFQKDLETFPRVLGQRIYQHQRVYPPQGLYINQKRSSPFANQYR